MVRDELGNYKMVGIGLAGHGGTIGHAMRASDVQRTMGITFGLPAPTAVAGTDQEVRPRETVTLSAAGSRSNIDGDTKLTLQWEQIYDNIDEPVEPFQTHVVTIINRDQATASFDAPNQAAELKFRLIVTDGNGA